MNETKSNQMFRMYFLNGVVILSCLFLFTSAGSASLLAYEDFDYGTDGLDGQSGGTGFGGNWVSGYETSSESLEAPDGYGFIPSGGRIQADMTDTDSYRDLGFQMDLNPVSGEETYYFSILFQRNDSSNGTGGEWVHVIRLVDSAGTAVAYFQVTSAEQVVAFVSGGTAVASAQLIDLNKPYLIVCKLIARSAGNDEVFIKFYETGKDTVMDEPYFWDSQCSGNSSHVITRLTMQFGNLSDEVLMDELRIGTTWASVVNNTVSGHEMRNVPVEYGLIAHLDSQHVVIGEDPVGGGYRVRSMIDLTGNNNDAVQELDFSMPEYIPNGDNGFPAVRFDGEDDYLEIDANSLFVSDQIAWFVVFKPNTITPASASPVVIRSGYESGAGVNSQYFWGTIDLGSGSTWFHRSHARSAAGSMITPGAFAPVTTEWRVLQAWWNSDDVVRQKMNYDYYRTASGADGIPAGHVRTRIACDTYTVAPRFFYSADYAEILIYNRQLTNGELEIMGSYLANKYGITTLYPAVAPVNCGEVWANQLGEPSDFNQDCMVNLDDFSMMAELWLDVLP